MLPWTRLSIDQSSLQGCTNVKLQRSDLQGGGHRVRERSTKAIRHKVSHPSAINREVIRQTISYVRRALDPNPNVLLHGARLANEAKPKQMQIHTPRQIRQHHHFPAQAAVLLTSEDLRTRLRCRGRPYTIFPRVGSAYKPEGY